MEEVLDLAFESGSGLIGFGKNICRIGVGRFTKRRV